MIYIVTALVAVVGFLVGFCSGVNTTIEAINRSAEKFYPQHKDLVTDVIEKTTEV